MCAFLHFSYPFLEDIFFSFSFLLLLEPLCSFLLLELLLPQVFFLLEGLAFEHQSLGLELLESQLLESITLSLFNGVHFASALIFFSHFTLPAEAFRILEIEFGLAASIVILLTFSESFDTFLLFQSLSGQSLHSEPFFLDLCFLLEPLQFCDAESLLLGEPLLESELSFSVGHGLLLEAMFFVSEHLDPLAFKNGCLFLLQAQFLGFFVLDPLKPELLVFFLGEALKSNQFCILLGLLQSS